MLEPWDPALFFSSVQGRLLLFPGRHCCIPSLSLWLLTVTGLPGDLLCISGSWSFSYTLCTPLQALLDFHFRNQLAVSSLTEENDGHTWNSVNKEGLLSEVACSGLMELRD